MRILDCTWPNRRRTIRVRAAAVCAITVLFVVAIDGCATENAPARGVSPLPEELYHAASRPTAAPETLVERPAYRLNVGDCVAVRFHPNLRAVAQHEVRLSPGDVLTIRFPYDAKYDQRPAIQSDGRLRVLLLGAVRAAGLTLDEIGEQLRVGYARYLRDPELTVDLAAADARGVAVRQSLGAADGRRTPIKPDGTIDLPYVGEVPAAGRTVKALRGELAQRCEEAGLDELDVSVQVVAFAPRRLYVVGEVLAPGRIDAESPTSLLQALAAAGGLTRRGEARSVLLIRRMGLPLPEAMVVDLERLMAASGGPRVRVDPWLADGDIVYVPTTDLARTGDWIDQVFLRGLRAVLPREARGGLDVGYRLGGTTVRSPTRVRP